jgi:hypothetical protein
MPLFFLVFLFSLNLSRRKFVALTFAFQSVWRIRDVYPGS